MLRLELSEKEAALLSDILQSYVRDLRVEIVATENKEWREEMKGREMFCNGLVSRLTPVK